MYNMYVGSVIYSICYIIITILIDDLGKTNIPPPLEHHQRMALRRVRVRAIVRNPADPDLSKEVELEVDTLAPCNILPGMLLRELGIRRGKKESFRLVDGSIIERYTGRVEIEIQGKITRVKVAFGRRGDPQVLDAAVLEELGLHVDPSTGELKPVWIPLI